MRPHPDLDLLALHALGEPVLGAEDLAHLDGCARCRTSADELAATVGTVRGPRLDDAPAAAVPAHVWQGIAAELDLDPGLRPASVGPSSVDAGPRRSEGSTPAVAPASAAASTPAPATPPAPVVATQAPATPPAPVAAQAPPVPRGRHTSALRLLAVAAAGLAVGGAGTALLLQQPGDDDSPATPAVLAAADLEGFGAGEGTDVTGSARLAAVSTGTQQASTGRVLELWLDDLPDTGEAYLEVWLIDPGSGGMVSLGPLTVQAPGDATVSMGVPAGVDVGTYALVDVSAEPPDGDPTHSGVSLVRGTLGT